MPESYELVQRLRADGHAAVISGAGPTVLVLTRADEVDACWRRDEPGFVARALRPADGVRLIDPGRSHCSEWMTPIVRSADRLVLA